MAQRIVVGVSGMNAVDNPGPGIGVARSLKEDGELDVSIVGLVYDAMEPGIYMDWIVDKSLMMPYPSIGADGFLERLLHLKDSVGLDVVIPNLDSELPLYIKYADKLCDHGIKTFLPNLSQFRLRGKDKLPEVAEAMGIKLPKTAVVASPAMLSQAIDEIGLPVMVKGCFYQAYRCDTLATATARFHELVAEWGYPIIVQEVVTGDELNVIGLGDGAGHSLGLVGIKKVWVTALGKMWTGVTILNEPMLQAAERFIEHANWRGPFELECIAADDGIYLIEINPRFPAWVYFATGVGVNLPSRLLRHCLGLPSPTASEYPPGKLFVRYSYDLITEMTPFHNVITRGEHP